MELVEGSFRLTKAELKALVTFSATDESRPHLYGVAFDTNKARAASTDGHRLLMVQARSADVVGGSAVPTLLPLDACKQALSSCGKGQHITVRMPGAPLPECGPGPDNGLGMPTTTLAVVEIHEDLRPTDNALSVAHVRVNDDVKPPPVDQVVPQLDASVVPRTPFVSVSHVYLASMKLVGDAACAKGVEVWPPAEPLDPVVFKAESSVDGAEWTAVLMPMRGDRSPVKASADSAVAWAAGVVARERDVSAEHVRSQFDAALSDRNLPAPKPKPRRSREKTGAPLRAV